MQHLMWKQWQREGQTELKLQQVSSFSLEVIGQALHNCSALTYGVKYILHRVTAKPLDWFPVSLTLLFVKPPGWIFHRNIEAQFTAQRKEPKQDETLFSPVTISR